MPVRFSVLASGSAGNASLLAADGFGVLLDVGLGPRQLARRLAAVGASWRDVHAVLLTHTHSDHWNDRTFGHLLRQRIPLYCHPEHHGSLLDYSPSFKTLLAEKLVRDYLPEADLLLGGAVCCRPLALRHDGSLTCGFRFEASPDLFGQACAVAYAADLGSWQPELADALADVDVLAVEFNHDVGLECSSGRSFRLIARVLGDDGHLSNEQAAELVREVVRRSAPGRLQHLVQLHLSRDCNRPHLARDAALKALEGCRPPVQIHTACQDEIGPCIALGQPASARGRRRSGAARKRQAPAADASSPVQPWLPGWEDRPPLPNTQRP